MGHDLQDRTSFELARAIASRLRSHPEWVDRARSNLDRWQRRAGSGRPEPRWSREWREVLARPVDDVVSMLLAPTEKARWLRQSSPFTGMLTEDEVRDIKQRCRDATSRP
ncbi:MAG TPA: hypothetical protein VHC70_08000 [Phycisphaerales bacterium]|jgi:hypothetical protein|nr:hypothetical protein [Phycisphaerales bacterium]